MKPPCRPDSQTVEKMTKELTQDSGSSVQLQALRNELCAEQIRVLRVNLLAAQVAAAASVTDDVCSRSKIAS